MQVRDFHYELPEELIARYPLPERSASRLLCLDRKTGALQHNKFNDLPALLSPGDLLVCNNSRVIAARLKGFKETGGQVEVFVERILDDHRILAQISASKTPKPGSLLSIVAKSGAKTDSTVFKVLDRKNELFELVCQDKRPILEIIETIGEIPIPPYFQREAEVSDEERYQTIYAEHKGSVAAPTAGLHFDKNLFSELRNKKIEIGYVTLHVGAGTFAPIRVENIAEHRMHAEHIEVSSVLCEQINKTKARGGRIVAVGTTTARSLETASHSGTIEEYKGDTDIFIYPGFKFNCVDALITNFHLPSSTLMMLVSAFGGYEHVMTAYQSAVENQYRFYSYGDAMFVK